MCKIILLECNPVIRNAAVLCFLPMKTIGLLILLLVLPACVPENSIQANPAGKIGLEDLNATPHRSELPNLGKAPELENQIWINSDTPLRLADLRGSVVLIEMWTFG